MESLKGEFRIINQNEKFRIFYLENTTMIPYAEQLFDSELSARTYVVTHRTQLEEYVLKVIKLKREQEQERLRIEEEKRKKEAEKERKRIEKENKKIEKKAEREKNKVQRKKIRNTAIASVLATSMFLTGGHFAAVGIANLIDKHDKKTGTSQNGNTEPTKGNSDLGISNGIDGIVSKDEELNQENFEKLAAGFTKICLDKKLNISTEDVIKFVSIVNIDTLAEENPELARELFGTQTKEEYLQDAAKMIGMVYSYNYQIFENEGTTKNFIRISDSVYGSQKEILKIVESYVDQIALVRNDAEKVNELIAELIVRLGDTQSELSYLDNGVGFGMQVCIELIRSYLAKDVISQENFDMLSTLTSSDEYVSNIFTIYDGCMNSYTRKK